MSTIEERRRIAEAGTGGDSYAPRVVLQPIAAPSILGLMGFFGGTLIVASHLAGWWATPGEAPLYLFPFAAMFGGLAQFMAGMWSYRARDAVATLAHGTWGAFWLGYGILFLLVATGQLQAGTTLDEALGFWFVALAAVTLSAMAGAFAEGNLGVGFVLFTLAAGSALAAAGLIGGGVNSIWAQAGGWVFVVSAVAAWYTATAMILHAATGKTILPLFKTKKASNIPGKQTTHPIQLEWAEPGVKQGQ